MIGTLVVVIAGLSFLAGYVVAHIEAALNERGGSTDTDWRENQRTRRHDEAGKHPRSLSVVSGSGAAASPPYPKRRARHSRYPRKAW